MGWARSRRTRCPTTTTLRTGRLCRGFPLQFLGEVTNPANLLFDLTGGGPLVESRRRRRGKAGIAPQDLVGGIDGGGGDATKSLPFGKIEEVLSTLSRLSQFERGVQLKGVVRVVKVAYRLATVLPLDEEFLLACFRIDEGARNLIDGEKGVPREVGAVKEEVLLSIRICGGRRPSW